MAGSDKTRGECEMSFRRREAACGINLIHHPNRPSEIEAGDRRVNHRGGGGLEINARGGK